MIGDSILPCNANTGIRVLSISPTPLQLAQKIIETYSLLHRLVFVAIILASTILLMFPGLVVGRIPNVIYIPLVFICSLLMVFIFWCLIAELVIRILNKWASRRGVGITD